MTVLAEFLRVFLTGGLLCVTAQVLIDKTKLTPARILTAYVVAGVFLSGVGVYEKIESFASMGARVPLTGFGYALAEGVKKAVDEKGAIGILSGGISATSIGICTAICSALLVTLVCKSHPK